MPIPEILPFVRDFLRYAARHPETSFAVTPIGTGLAGYSADWVAPLFCGYGENVYFTDWDFEKQIPIPYNPLRVIVAGSRQIKDKALVWPHLDRLKARFADETPFEIVCGEAAGVDTLGRQWAEANNHPIKSFPAPWSTLDAPCASVNTTGGRSYNAQAGPVRNAWMAAYGSHLVAFWNGRSAGTKQMIKLCRLPEVAVPVWLPRMGQ